MSKRMTIEDAEREKRDVLIFAIDELVRDPEDKTFIVDIYDAYKTWRKRMNMPPTKSSIDSFGKLFPKTFERKMFYKNGETGRGIVGITLRMRN